MLILGAAIIVGAAQGTIAQGRAGAQTGTKEIPAVGLITHVDRVPGAPADDLPATGSVVLLQQQTSQCAPVAAGAVSTLTITPTFDSSITSDVNAANIEAAINAAIAVYQAKFTDPISATIKFKEMSGGLGQSAVYFSNMSYSTFLTALKADNTSADDATALSLLPASSTNPVNGSTTINVKTANARAIGINSNPPTSDPFDGTISLNTSLTLPGSSGTTGQFDLQAVVEHEIDEVLGLGSSLPTPSNVFNTIFPQDLYRYDQNGARTFNTTSTAKAFFSIDGPTRIVQFDNQNDGGDFGDWQSNPLPSGVSSQVQDAFGTSGSHPTLGPSEIRSLDVIGYNIGTPPPTPTGLTATAGSGRVNLSWSASTGATSYNVKRSTSSGAETVLAAGVTTTSFSDTSATKGQRYFYVVSAVNSGGESANCTEAAAGPARFGDFDGDGRDDVAVYRPTTGAWTIVKSNGGSTLTKTLGGPGFAAVPGDYDGDGTMDIATYQISTGNWSVLTSSSGFATTTTKSWGGPGYYPVPGDYDGDGKTDFAIYQPSSGTWFVLLSGNNYTTTLSRSWGGFGYIPVSGDYDGDGNADFALYQPSTGYWYILLSGANYTTTLTKAWGGPTYQPVPGDYDGDGKQDLAVYQASSGTWLVMLSSTNYITTMTKYLGGVGFVPVPADYDGDGTTDFAVYLKSTGTFSILKSSNNYVTPATVITAGGTSDDAITTAIRITRPDPSHFGDFDADLKSDITVYNPSSGGWSVLLSGGGNLMKTVGGSGYVAAPGDYDGDGVTDFAAYNTTTGNWQILLSSTGYTVTLSKNWGGTGYQAVPGDYDGDGQTDIAVYNTSTGFWYVLLSSAGYTNSFSRSWGGTGYAPEPGDYDGDGLTDLAVYNTSTGVWSVLLSGAGFTTSLAKSWGGAGYNPVPGDFDGDGKTDFGVYVPSTGTWYVLLSGAGYTASLSRNWGGTGYTPVYGDYDGDGKADFAVYQASSGTWYVLLSGAGYTTALSRAWGGSPLPLFPQ